MSYRMVKKTQKQLRDELIKKSEDKIIEINKAIDLLDKECEDKLRPSRELIKEIQKPYDIKFRDSKNEITKLEEHISKCEEEIREIELKEKIEDSKKLGKYNPESFESFIKLNKLISNSSYLEIKEKKELPNGIQIFKVEDSYNWDKWFAFLKFKCVGFSFRRKGQHRGDETIPFSYIGEIDDKKEIRLEKENKKWGTTEMKNATFTDWKKKLEKLDPNKIKEINLKDKEVMKIVVEHERIYY